jgi:bla regulator protein blaR1
MGEISRWLVTFLLNSVWQITAITAIALLCTKLLHRMPSRYAHTAWVLALIACLLVPVATLLIQAGDSGGVRVANAVSGPALAANESTERIMRGLPVSFHSLSHAIFFPRELMRVLLWAYGSLLLFRAMRLVWVSCRTFRVRQRAYARRMPLSLLPVAERCMRAFSLQDVPVLCSAEVSGPATIGFRRPVLVLPETFFVNGLPEDDFFSALFHELAHIRRRDFFFNLLYEIAYVPVCFHPCAALIMARIAQTRELACDGIAARMLPSAAHYARSLLHIARTMLFGVRAGASLELGLFDTNALEERVMNILKTTKANSTGTRVSRLIAACLVGAVSLGISAFSLRLTAENAPANLERFAGTWETKYKGRAFFTLKLRSANGTLVGTCTHVTRVEWVDGGLIPGTDETTTDKILEVRAYGEKLLLKIGDGDSSSDAIPLEFTLTAKDQGDGIVFVSPSLDGPPPPKKPWHFQKVGR